VIDAILRRNRGRKRGPDKVDFKQNEAEAQKLLIEELKAETRADFRPDAVAQAWSGFSSPAKYRAI